VYDRIVDKKYTTAVLENGYVKLVMLPEIGGRIFEAQDKTNNNYDFFYRQEVIKPALVGLAGPWISGGVEFNWPQHHRPGTYLPCDVHLEEEKDGSKTIWMSEHDPMNRLKGMHGIRLRPGSSLIELRARLFNRTPLVQTFLWWANVAVRVHDRYESFMPPDVHYVADHAVRAMSSYPYAENDYYGIPYHERKGRNDLRWYQNIPVPTSYMVCESKYNFFGGYDHAARGGFLHVADRHIAPGKKQWTWGSAAFGKAWDRELTDKGGPYFELMAGVYTDNQPDFTYLAPFETKTFSQFWWPYKNLGVIQNANEDLAVHIDDDAGSLHLGIASTRSFNGLIMEVNGAEGRKIFKDIKVEPGQPWQAKGENIAPQRGQSLSLKISDASGNVLLTYNASENDRKRNRQVAVAPPMPSKAGDPVELNLIAEHLDQYRHPSRYPEPYLEEALRINPRDFHALTAKGKLLLNYGLFAEAEQNFRGAMDVITSYHPNPRSGEAHYFAGLSCLYQDKMQEAYELLYKSTWDYAWRSAGYFLISTIDCRNSEYQKALDHIELSLDTNRQNNKAHLLKAIIKRKLGKTVEAIEILKELMETDPLDHWARFEMTFLKKDHESFFQYSRNDAQTIIDIAFDYLEAGFYQEAAELILQHHRQVIEPVAVPNPMSETVMTSYILAWSYDKLGDKEKCTQILDEASQRSPDFFFPSRLQEQRILEWAIEQSKYPESPAYGLGNYMYDKRRHKDAIHLWELAAAHEMRYGTLYRNLGIAYWNTGRDGDKAQRMFIKALDVAPHDNRILYEYDQLRKKINDNPVDRLQFLESRKVDVLERDDCSVELAALYNFHGEYQKALDLLESKKFHPWEGGEGQVLLQYSRACLALGEKAFHDGKYDLALKYFEKSVQTPDNLGEKYHPLQSMAHINYWKGRALKMAGKLSESKKQFELSISEQSDFVEMAVSQYTELSHYRALALFELDREDEAQILLEEIKSFAKQKLKEKAEIDYFATSLPILLVFEEDLDKRNQWEAKYLLALSEIGLGNKQEAQKLLEEVLHLNVMHYGANETLKKF
jgi:tetratricopeptide (TPR) repeat protein